MALRALTNSLTSHAAQARRPLRGASALDLIAAWCLLATALSSCGDDDYPYYDDCRYEPGLCAGGLGGLCEANIDCGVGFCCRDPKECGGGMCTLSCRSDYD